MFPLVCIAISGRRDIYHAPLPLFVIGCWQPQPQVFPENREVHQTLEKRGFSGSLRTWSRNGKTHHVPGGLTIHPQSATLLRMAARKRRVRAVRSEPVERVSADEIARILMFPAADKIDTF